MERPGFLPRQVEAAEDARQAGRAQALAEPVLDPAAQRRQRPIDAAIPGPVGAAEHGRQQHRLLGLRQRRAPPGLRPVAQALQALGVVADDRVPQRLPLHPGQPGRLRPALALQSAGDRQHPCRRPRAPLAPRQRPQPVGAGQVGPDLQRRPHRSLRLRQTDRESRQPDPRIHRRVSLSARRYYRKKHPTFSDTLATVRRQLWSEQGLLTSRHSPEPPKIQPALREGIIHALCHAA